VKKIVAKTAVDIYKGYKIIGIHVHVHQLTVSSM